MYGDRYQGILDALASSGDTLTLAVEMLLPFAAPMLAIADEFLWWGMMFAVAWTIGKIFFQQAPVQELPAKLGTILLLFIFLIPVQVAAGPMGKLPMASYVTWKVSSSVDTWFRSGVDSVIAFITQHPSGLPMPLIKTLNQNNLVAIEETPLAPIISDYVENCSTAVTFEAEGGSKLTMDNWRSVGLLGTGGLGFESSDVTSRTGWFADRLVKLVSFGSTDMQGFYDNISDWEGQREKVKEILAQKTFPRDVRLEGYRIPTQEFWKKSLDPGYSPSGPVHEPILLQTEYLSVTNAAVLARTNIIPDQGNIFHADSCLELYQLAHRSTRNYLLALREFYDVAMDTPAITLGTAEAQSAAGAALGEAMRSFYRTAANRESATGESPRMHAFSPKDNITPEEGWGTAMGIINDLASILLNINLDQWILSMIGGLSLAIAMIFVIYPLFALTTPFVGAGALVVPLQVAIMLQLTMMLTYAVAAIGLEFVAALNVVANNSSFGAYSMSSSSASLTVAVLTSIFVFPMFAGKFAYVLIFGSRGVGEAGRQPLSLGAQFVAAAAVVKAAALAARGMMGKYKPRDYEGDKAMSSASSAASGGQASLGGPNRPTLPGGGQPSPMLPQQPSPALPSPGQRVSPISMSVGGLAKPVPKRNG